MATCQAQLPACHRTAEVLRGEHATSDGVSHPLSPPFVIHTVNLIINEPFSPPSSRSQQRHIHSRSFHVFAKRWSVLSDQRYHVFIISIFYISIHIQGVEEEGTAWFWRKWDAVVTWRWRSSYDVRKCRSPRPKPDVLKCRSFFAESLCVFSFVDRPKSCAKMPKMDGILYCFEWRARSDALNVKTRSDEGTNIMLWRHW